MWSMVRQVFPTKGDTIKTIFAVHLAMLAWFTSDRFIPIDYTAIRWDNVYCIHLLSGVLFVLLFASLYPSDSTILIYPIYASATIELGCLGIDMYMMFCPTCSTTTFGYWVNDVVMRAITVVFLCKIGSNCRDSFDDKCKTEKPALVKHVLRNQLQVTVIFVVHFVLLIWLIIDQSLTMDWVFNLELYWHFFLHMLSGFFFLTLLWALVKPHNKAPVDFALLIELVCIAFDAYVLYYLYYYWADDSLFQMKRTIFHHSTLAVSIVSFIILHRIASESTNETKNEACVGAVESCKFYVETPQNNNEVKVVTKESDELGLSEKKANLKNFD